MNDIRRRHEVPRRNYGLPGHLGHQSAQSQPANQHEVEADGRRIQVSRLKNRKVLAAVLIAFVICIIAVSGGILVFRSKPAPPAFPSGLAARLSYPIYYSADSSSGFSLEAGSAKIQAGILFYTLANRSKKIFVTEQNAPTKKVDLNSLPNHTRLNIPVGQAYIGTGLGNPSVVIMTPATLIVLSSNKGVTKNDIVSVAQKLALLNQQSTP